MLVMVRFLSRKPMPWTQLQVRQKMALCSYLQVIFLHAKQGRKLTTVQATYYLTHCVCKLNAALNVRMYGEKKMQKAGKLIGGCSKTCNMIGQAIL